MSVDKQHIEQYERYLKGEMTPEEAHAFERSVLDDPFAAEALEGYEAHGVDAFRDLDRLKNKVQSKKKSRTGFLRIAASIALLIAAFIGVLFLTDNVQEEQLVMEEKTSQTDFQSLEPLDNALADQEAIEIIDNVPPAEEVIAENEDQKSSEELSTKEEAVTLNEPLQTAESVVIEQDVGEVFYSDEEETNDEIESPVVQEEVVAEALAFEEDDKVSDEIVLESITATSPLKSKKQEEVDAEPQKKELNNNAQVRGQAAFARSASAATITGKVTDDYGETLPGVNVVIKGTTTGTTTDLDGNYRLSKFDGMTLVFSFVGFESQEVEVGNRNTIDVAMGGAAELQEVVVTAQGVQEDNNTFSPARPESGKNAYKVYLEANLKYPTAALENDIEGTVTVEVRISPSGAIAETMIKKSLGYGCDEEAIRLIEEGPDWSPAIKNGTPVNDSVIVKVKFELEN